MDTSATSKFNRIKQLRKKNDISQNELASIIGVNRSTVSTWESGKQALTANAILKLAEYFNVSTDYILYRTENDSPCFEKNAILSSELFLETPTQLDMSSLSNGNRRALIEQYNFLKYKQEIRSKK